jgi:hypothetical protein
MPTICQSTRMEGLFSQDLKPKFSLEAKIIVILKKNHFYKGVPLKTCYSIESSQSLKAKKISSSGRSKQLI